MIRLRHLAASAALLPAWAGAAPYPVTLDARAHGAPFEPCGAACTAVVRTVTERLGDATDPAARLRITLGPLERAPAPPGIGFQWGNPQPDLGRASAVPQLSVRCEVDGTGTPGHWHTRLALPEPTALERLAGTPSADDPDRYTGAITHACLRALRAAALAPPETDLRSAVVVVTPQDAGAHAPAGGSTLRHARDGAQALKDAAPGDVVFEFGQKR